MSSKDLDQQPSEELTAADFATQLQKTEQALQALKERHAQVQQDEQHQQYLQQRLDQVQQELKHSRSPKLKTELRQIQRQLDELEIALESRLFSWSSLKEPFWQAIRFGGIGVVIGWVLKACSG
ncbi:MAG: DUF2203 domain-containing protein [Cyanothece sp. SIO1E1]|nr:DUF2203 domain-containing protein [Cyanothece sp. SIO1E1]